MIKLLITFVFLLLPTFLYAGGEADALLTPEEVKWLDGHNGKLRYAVEPGYAPLTFIDSDGEFRGIAADYLSLIEKKIGYKFQRIYLTSWQELIEKAQKKEIDLIGCIQKTPDRLSHLTFTTPYMTIPNAIIVRQGSADSLTLDQMDGMSVVVVKGFANAGYLKKNANIELRYADTCSAALQMLSFGLVDAMVNDLAGASHTISQLGITNLKTAGTIDFTWGLGFASRSDMPILNSIIQKAMDAITPDERNRVFNKWIVLGNYKEEFTRKVKSWLTYSIIAVFILVSLIIIWIFTLKRQIAYRTSQLWEELKVRQRTEAALTKSEENSRQLSNASWEAIVIHDNGILLQANSRFYEMFGYPPGSITGTRFIMKVIEPETVDAVSTQINSGGYYPVRTTGNRKNGSRFPIEIQTKYLVFNGKEVRVTAIRDITNIIQQEEKLKKWEHIFKHTETGIVVSDEGNNTLSQMNPAFSRMLGYTVEELKGKNVRFVFPADKYDELETIIKAVSKKGHSIFETQLVKKDGTVFPVSGHATAVRGRTESDNYFVVNVMDISHLKELEKQRVEADKQLRQAQKMEAIGTLAGGVAHDFNNILYPIIGYSELLLMESTEGTKHFDCLTGIVNSANRAKDLVNQILTFSRQSEQILKPLKIQTVLSEALKLSRSTLPSTITIKESIDTGCRATLADPTQIHQIIMNLVTNAFHAMEDTGGELGISLSEVVLSGDETIEAKITPGRYLHLTVSDTGTGIESQLMGRLFEPYFTTKESGKGTGLGLSVVHGIVSGYGGSIDIQSETGNGSVFHIYLPVMDQHDVNERSDSDLEIRGGTESILVVDDEEQITAMLEKSLKKLGYEVTSHSNSHKALELIRELPDKYDLVISDLTMPDMTGDTLATKIHEIRPDMPVVLCTGYEGKLTREDTEAFGVNDFLIKPIARNDLARSIRSVLDRKTCA